MERHIRTYIPFFIISLIAIFVFFGNYQPGTYLLGWDNIMPELDLWLNIKRNIFAVWQEYRGLGLIDGQAQSANIVHTLINGFFRLFIPRSITRYVIIILLHLIGGLGMYTLSSKLLRHKLAGIIGALFYMFNLGTIQQFFAPLESFIFHFAFLPWIAYFGLLYIQKPQKSHLVWFAIANILILPQAFIPTVFIAYMLFIGVFALTELLQRHSLVRWIHLFLVIILLNSFWLLPYLYRLPEKAKVIQNARINRFASEETFLRNKARGGLSDVLTLRGFMLDVTDYDSTLDKNIHFMKAWSDFSQSATYRVLYLYLFAIGMVGLFLGLGKRKNPASLPFVGAVAIGFIALATDVPIVSWLHASLRQYFPALGEAFRFPFTKFITLFTFGLSFCIAAGIAWISKTMHKKSWFKLGHRVLFLTALLASLTISLPVFNGQFFSPTLRRELPEYYFDLFAELQKQPQDKRIAVLPAHTFWSWQSREWGYVGSGFEWYGIEQPLLVRAFDPWSAENEQFYTELSYAVSQDSQVLFQNTLNKYNIGMVLVDETIVNNLSNKPINYEKLAGFVASSPQLAFVNNFGPLRLYRNLNEDMQSVAYTPSAVSVTVNKQYKPSKLDVAFYENGHYVQGQFGSLPDIMYPFSGLLQPDWNLTGNTLEIASRLDSDIEAAKLSNNMNLTLHVPSMFEHEQLIPVQFEIVDGTLKTEVIYPTFQEDGPSENSFIEVQGEVFTSNITLDRVEMIHINGELTVEPQHMAFIKNNFVNTIILEGDGATQRVEIDTSSVPAQNHTIEIPRVSPYQLSFPLIDAYGYGNIVRDLQYNSIEQSDTLTTRPCASDQIDIVESTIDSLDFSTTCTSSEIVYELEDMPHAASYVLFAVHTNTSGLPLYIYLNNDFEKRSEFEARLQSGQKSRELFFIHPTQKFFEGYGLHVRSHSIGTTPSLSKLSTLSLYPFPLETIERISISGELGPTEKPQYLNHTKTANYMYNIDMRAGFSGQQTDGYVTLFQAYDPGWHAYTVNGDGFLATHLPFLVGNRLEDHVVANNWTNAWRYGNEKSFITIIFWPQYLQYIGFALMIIAIVMVQYGYGYRSRAKQRSEHTSQESKED